MEERNTPNIEDLKHDIFILEQKINDLKNVIELIIKAVQYPEHYSNSLNEIYEFGKWYWEQK